MSWEGRHHDPLTSRLSPTRRATAAKNRSGRHRAPGNRRRSRSCRGRAPARRGGRSAGPRRRGRTRRRRGPGRGRPKGDQGVDAIVPAGGDLPECGLEARRGEDVGERESRLPEGPPAEEVDLSAKTSAARGAASSWLRGSDGVTPPSGPGRRCLPIPPPHNRSRKSKCHSSAGPLFDGCEPTRRYPSSSPASRSEGRRMPFASRRMRARSPRRSRSATGKGHGRQLLEFLASSINNRHSGSKVTVTLPEPTAAARPSGSSIRPSRV